LLPARRCWFGAPHSYGLIREHGKLMFVTAGLVSSVPPIRFNCPPEFAILTIEPEPLKR